MKIQQVEIQNFRSIKSVKFNLLPYMVFVGKNNSGKSNLMIALDAFFSANVEADDFRKEKGETSKNIEIIVTFFQLNKKEKDLFARQLIDEGKDNEHLTLRLSASLLNDFDVDTKYEFFSQTINCESSENKKRYGLLFDEEIYKSVNKILENENIPQDFKDKIEKLIDLKGIKKLTKQEFIKLRDDYQKDLLIKQPSLVKQEYQKININSKNVKSMLGNFFFVPAVQDIEKETKYTAKENKNLNHLMNYVLDQMQDTGQRKKKEQELRQLLKDLYRLDEKGSEINNLKQLLNSQLKNFDDSLLTFDTKLPNLSKMIRDSLKIYIDDGIRTEVQYKGHGLQRYFMVILFKVWSEKLMENKSKETDAECTSTYFAIEEPELFLHPQYQRMMRIYLQNISENEGHQIILNTHSPHFIEFNNIFQVAKVYKHDLNEYTKVIQPLEFNNDGTIKIKDMVCSWGSFDLQKRFRAINRVNMNYYLNPERNELFFADKVVLIEGQTEKMLFQAWANIFYSNDIALVNTITYIDCLGKFNFQQFIKILWEFKIPFVAIVDADTDKTEKTRDKNIHIKKDAIQCGGKYFELEPDFEGEFNIREEEIDHATGDKKNKPYYAFKQFFDLDGAPKENELKYIEAHPKLRQIFKEIYGKEPKM